jgi:DNA-binding transcriptional LysR family regulator
MYVGAAHRPSPARRRTTRLADLVGESWLQGDQNGLFRKMHIAACERAGFEPRVGFQVDDYDAVQGLTGAGVAISGRPPTSTGRGARQAA